MKKRYLFTSESVSEGHPDKIADQISDAILDAYLTQDPNSKVACETFVTHKGIIISGEIFSQIKNKIDVPEIVRRTINEIGYTSEQGGYDSSKITIDNQLHEQSPEIRMGVDEGGAGDQGLMFGYACRETDDLMPLPIWLSHRIMERQALLRKKHNESWLLPDAKSQVTIIYEDGIPTTIDTIVVSTQHKPFISGNNNRNPASLRELKEQVIEKLIKPVIPAKFKNDDIRFMINPSGSFEIGGPVADTGLTGRKIIVDTYGGSCPHGGGAFSGKDATKVDRSGAYAARYIAKNIVAAGLADKCMVQLSYAIGKAEPVSFMLEFFGTGKVDEEIVIKFIKNIFDLTPNGIITKLELKLPIYLKTSVYGHFGRSLPEFTWEKTDLVNQLKELLKK